MSFELVSTGGRLYSTLLVEIVAVEASRIV